ncbi:MAG: exodeoxyribonuclease VII large subunit, partial [Rhodospirillaceae bacterium]|nr:exodeoxyribonuclease VII large subunit [Rhodospirillaceae bacterium]
ERTEELAARMPGLVKRRLADLEQRWASAGQLLESLSYQRVLDRGFALVRDAAGEPVTSAAGARPGLDVAIRFSDGEVGARIAGPAAPPARPAPKRRKTGGNDDQGTLL